MNSANAFRILALSVGLFAGISYSSQLQAEQFDPGAEVVIDGTVDSVVNEQSFWLNTEGSKVLIYQPRVLRQAVRPGASMRVTGTVSDDWIRLADIELVATLDQPQADTSRR